MVYIPPTSLCNFYCLCVRVCRYVHTSKSHFTQFCFNTTRKLTSFSKLCYNFWFNRYRWSVAVLIDSRRLAGNNLTVIPSVMYALITLMVSSHSSFTVLLNSIGILTNMSEKHKSTSPRAIQVKRLSKDSHYWREIWGTTLTWKRQTNWWPMPYLETHS